MGTDSVSTSGSGVFFQERSMAMYLSGDESAMVPESGKSFILFLPRPRGLDSVTTNG